MDLHAKVQNIIGTRVRPILFINFKKNQRQSQAYMKPFFNTYNIKNEYLLKKDLEGLVPNKFNGCILILRGNINEFGMLETLLANILKSINIELKNCLILDNTQNKLSLKELLKLKYIKKIFAFGTHPKELNYNIQFEPYSIIDIQNCKICFSASLSDLNTNVDLKQKLWKSLKKINL